MKPMKLMISLGLLIGGTIGGWIGELMTKGNWFSMTSILLSGVGSIVGIWAGYKIAKKFF